MSLRFLLQLCDPVLTNMKYKMTNMVGISCSFNDLCDFSLDYALL